MNRKRALMIAGALALAVPLTFGAVKAMDSGDRSTGIQTAFFGGGHHRGWGRGGRGMQRLCSPQRDERIEDVIEFVEGFVDFSPEQSEAWTKLTGAVRTGSATVDETCGKVRQAGRPKSAPEKLALAETMMTTGLSVVQQVRPAFEEFYGLLSEKQQDALDGLMNRGKGRHGWRQ